MSFPPIRPEYLASALILRRVKQVRWIPHGHNITIQSNNLLKRRIDPRSNFNLKILFPSLYLPHRHQYIGSSKISWRSPQLAQRTFILTSKFSRKMPYFDRESRMEFT